MIFTILIPHYRSENMTRFSVNQFFKYKGKHEIHLIVGDNNAGDGTIDGLRDRPYLTIVDYPKDKLQSHGILLNYILELGLVKTEYFITAESDSFPTVDNWLDSYADIINQGYDCAGSLLTLSGGSYIHPAGALYKKSIWEEAKKYCDEIQYSYLPNIAMKEGHPCHLMVHNKIFGEFCKDPSKYVEVHASYKENSALEIANKAVNYEVVVNPFHNGMGQFQESYSTYGQRNTGIEPQGILLKNNEFLIYRMGYEPGQWFCYWQLAMGKKIFQIPTKTVWMGNRENQQQEYTIMDNGFKHLWGVSSYNGCIAEELQDIVKFKEKQVNDLIAEL
jgi:hypothetical protein